MTTSSVSHCFLEIKGLSKTFPDETTAIADVSMKVESGSFVSLVGASGVGKSTLVRLAAGLIGPTSGSILVNGQPPRESRLPIGLVFQHGNLMPWRTALQNVLLPLQLAHTAGDEALDRAMEMIQLVGLQGFEQSFPAQLSGGMAQRVALARALIHRPSLLLLDEPLGSLDALSRERMAEELLRIWQAMPVTVLMVTHSISEAVLLADRVFVMSGKPGSITAAVDIELERPRSFADEGAPEFLHYTQLIRAAIAIHPSPFNERAELQ